MRRYLLIVVRDRPDLWDMLRRRFAGDPEVRVILDRRQRERRQRVQVQELDRRRADRRRRLSTDKQIRDTGFAIVDSLWDLAPR